MQKKSTQEKHTPAESRPVEHLSVTEAEELLEEKGIPNDQVDLYRNTIVAGNISFWDQLLMLDRAGLLKQDESGRIRKTRRRKFTVRA